MMKQCLNVMCHAWWAWEFQTTMKNIEKEINKLYIKFYNAYNSENWLAAKNLMHSIINKKDKSFFAFYNCSELTEVSFIHNSICCCASWNWWTFNNLFLTTSVNNWPLF